MSERQRGQRRLRAPPPCMGAPPPRGAPPPPRGRGRSAPRPTGVSREPVTDAPENPAPHRLGRVRRGIDG